MYDSHKLAKKTYRKARREAVQQSMSQHYRAIDALFISHDSKRFWNKISTLKKSSSQSGGEISLSKLCEYYGNKFTPKQGENQCDIEEADTFVRLKCAEMESLDVHNNLTSPMQIDSLIRSLKKGRSPGEDGIMAEHLIHGLSYKLCCLISELLNACIKFGIVPDTFTRGMLVPILKKPSCDSSKPESYRPITISSTFAKLLEMHILEQCSFHRFNDLQFGFIEGLGTDIAATLAHDVISYCNFQNSPVYVCSLDAEGAFDCIPHPILFRKCYGVVPDPLWRLLVHWYSRLSVRVKWNKSLSAQIRVLQGTRQGGLSSPFLFNLFYQNLIDDLNEMSCGITIDDMNYNVFCYADDILLASLSVTGLQKLIKRANDIITHQGLRFNPSKSVCAMYGKSPFMETPSLMLEGTELELCDEILYLGVTLSNDDQTHADNRIKSSRRAYYALQGCGLHPQGLAPETVTHLWSAAVRPVLLYGSHCTYLKPSAVREMQKTQAQLLKVALGVRKHCHSSMLMDALKLEDVQTLINIARLRTLKSAIQSESRASNFFAFCLCQHLMGKACDPKGTIVQSSTICKDAGLSLQHVLLDPYSSLLPLHKKPVINDGVIDSIRQLLQFYSQSNCALLNVLLRSY